MDVRSSVLGTGPLFRGPNLRGHDRIPELAVVYLAITANLLLARKINSLDVVLVGRIARPVGQRVLAEGIRRAVSGERGPVIDQDIREAFLRRVQRTLRALTAMEQGEEI